MGKKKNAKEEAERAFERKDRLNVVAIGMGLFTIIPLILFFVVGQEEMNLYLNQIGESSNWSKLHLFIAVAFSIYGLGALINAGISSRPQQNLIMAYNLLASGAIGFISYSLYWFRFGSSAMSKGLLLGTVLCVLALVSYTGQKKFGDPLGIRKK